MTASPAISRLDLRNRRRGVGERHGQIRVVCNSGLHPQDVATARAAAAALRQEWCGSEPEALVDGGGEAAKLRLRRLYQFLASEKLQVKVLPDEYFGLVHGKAGVITLADGAKTAFLGSVNESRSAWTLNYELLWEDRSPEAVQWVQEEFDALWGTTRRCRSPSSSSKTSNGSAGAS